MNELPKSVLRAFPGHELDHKSARFKSTMATEDGQAARDCRAACVTERRTPDERQGAIGGMSAVTTSLGQVFGGAQSPGMGCQNQIRLATSAVTVIFPCALATSCARPNGV
jgi:hypothetical protein